MSETNLILGALGLPPESARNCVQELHLVPNGEFKKSVNGDLLFLESTWRRKYRSIISCKDINTPAMDGIWIGSQINVGCIQNLWQSIDIGKTQATLIRPAVSGSVNVMDYSGHPVQFTLTDTNVMLHKSHTEKIFLCFRPWLMMQVIDFSQETNEWGVSGGWKLTLEEV